MIHALIVCAIVSLVIGGLVVFEIWAGPPPPGGPK